ncbi:MAG: hypothetical protein VKK04_20145 [Synechococcales bacterium]|nr:hypothetical protein [Synechococcales bacterium]
MTQPNLLALAKRGNPDAIASLMNRSLHPKGIAAHVTRQGDRLQVVLESEQTVNPQILTAFVRDGLRNLGLESIHSVEILGRQTGQPRPAWSQTLDLGNPPTGDAPPTTPPTAPPPSRPAPPPARATARQPEKMPAPASPPPTTRIQSGEPTTIQARREAPDSPPVNRATSRSAPPQQSPVSSGQAAITDPLDSIDAIPDLAEDSLVTDAPASNSEYVVDDWGTDAAGEVDDSKADHVFASDSMEGATSDAAYAETIEDTDRVSARPQRGDIVHLGSSGYSGIYSRDAYGKPASPILFAAVSLLTAGWIAGLIGYSLWSYLTTPISVSEPGTAVSAQSSNLSSEAASNALVADNSPEAPLTDEEVVALVETSAEKAASAAALAQTAQSVDDWNLVISQWQRAIALLQQVPDSAPDYAAIETQLADYRRNLTAAEQQAANLPDLVTASLPSTVITVGEEVACPTTLTTASQPLELTNVRLASSGAATAQQVVGCITNNTEQTIASVSVSYRGSLADGATPLPDAEPPASPPAATPPSGTTDADNANSSDVANTVTPAEPSSDNANLQGQGVLTFANLAPGETVPFRSGFEVPPNLTTFEIQTVSWLPIGATETQQLDISVLLPIQ